MNSEEDPIQQAVHTAQEGKTNRVDTYIHAIIVMTVLISATCLRVASDLDVATLSTVYGAALGYATGLTVRKSGG